jgi:hypothetical protein
MCWTATRSIGLDLTVVPDEAFSVRYVVEAGVGIGYRPETGDIDARIHFAGVPSGAQLTSCHGVDEAAVLAKSSTWGLVKATYR